MSGMFALRSPSHWFPLRMVACRLGGGGPFGLTRWYAERIAPKSSTAFL